MSVDVQKQLGELIAAQQAMTQQIGELAHSVAMLANAIALEQVADDQADSIGSLDD